MTRKEIDMKQIIHTLGYVDDNDEIVIMGSIHKDNNERIVRFTLGEEITAQVLEASAHIPAGFVDRIYKGGS